MTVAVTPNDGWVFGAITGEWSAVVATARHRAPSDPEVKKEIDLKPANGLDNTWTFTMERAEAVFSLSYKKLLTNPDITIDDIADVTYNGKEQEPAITVKDGSAVLEEGVDYTLTYSNNINACDADAGENAPTVTITAVEGSNYSGETSVTFTIVKDENLVFFKPYRFEKTYGDPNFTVEPGIAGVGTLTYSSDDTSVLDVDSETGEVTIMGVGTVKIWATMSETDNYFSGSDWYEVTVAPKELDDTMIGDIDDQAFTGEELEPDITVKDGSAVLEEGTDFTVTYSNNVEVAASTAENAPTVTITAVEGGNYTGSASKTFAIKQAQATFAFEADEVDVTYGDENFVNAVTQYGDNAISFASSDTGIADVDSETGEVTIKGAGQCTITATMGDSDDYAKADDISFTLNVAPKTVTDNDVYQGEYDENGIPEFSVSVEAPVGTLVPEEGADYEIAYCDQEHNSVTVEKMANAPGEYIAVLTFSGNYDGTVEVTFTAIGGTTAINSMDNGQWTMDNWFDMNGRRLQGKPTRKGVYLLNGRKVVIK